jgi:sugar phosphate isomerase/epimerase
VGTLDEWKAAADRFTGVADALRPHGIAAGFHNHQREWTPLEGERPMDVIAAGTPSDFVLQFDVAPAVATGSDPVEWIRANPGRIRSVHCRDWGRANGSNLIFGEGDSPWPDIFAAAEGVGGVECYLIEHGHAEPDQEWRTAEQGLANWRVLRRLS